MMSKVNPPRTMLCPHCKRTMSKKSIALNRLSRDHILPVEWGGDNTWGDAVMSRNYRWACQECNSLRATVGHCVGALVCVLVVARDSRQTPLYVARGWNLQRTASLIQPPARPRRPSHAARRQIANVGHDYKPEFSS